MEYQIITLLTAAIFNAALGYIVLRGRHDVTAALFALGTTAVALWSVNIAFFLLTDDLEHALLFANAYYVAAAAIPLMTLYFFFYFLGYRRPRPRDLLYALPLIFSIAALAADKHILIQEIYYAAYGKNVVLNTASYAVYILYFLFFAFFPYLHLAKIYFATEKKDEKTQIALIFFGTLISFIFGMIFNLFLPALGNYQHIWLGPIFSLIMVASLAYAVFKHRLFNVRIVVAEVAFIGLLIILLFDLFVSDSTEEIAFKLATLASVAVFGFLIVKGIYKEVRIREQVAYLAEKVAVANERLEEMEQQKTEFVSIASHQLRTPLTAIKGYTSMLLEGSFGTLGDGAKNAARKMYNASQRLVRLVEDLLTMSRIEQGRITYEFSAVDIESLLRKVIDGKRGEIDARGLGVVFQSEERSAGHLVQGDHAKLGQAIESLLDNAIQYTSEGFIKVFLAKDRMLGKVRISVSDTGEGMDSYELKTLFENIENEPPTSITGIGLYIVNQVVKAHRGKLWADSPGRGAGSTFFIELPAIEEK